MFLALDLSGARNAKLGTDLSHKAQILCDVIVYVRHEHCAKRWPYKQYISTYPISIFRYSDIPDCQLKAPQTLLALT
jgi:hypothetical protein